MMLLIITRLNRVNLIMKVSSCLWPREITPTVVIVCLWPREKTPSGVSVSSWPREQTPLGVSGSWPREKTPSGVNVCSWPREETPSSVTVSSWPREQTPSVENVIISTEGNFSWIPRCVGMVFWTFFYFYVCQHWGFSS